MSSRTLYGCTIYTNGVGVTLSVYLHRFSQDLNCEQAEARYPAFSFVVTVATICPVRFWVFGGQPFGYDRKTFEFLQNCIGVICYKSIRHALQYVFHELFRMAC